MEQQASRGGESPVTIDILGLRVQSRSQEEINEAIGRIVHSGGHAVVPNVNVHFANLAWRREWLREFFNSAPVNFCDGAGIQLRPPGSSAAGSRSASPTAIGLIRLPATAWTGASVFISWAGARVLLRLPLPGLAPNFQA